MKYLFLSFTFLLFISCNKTPPAPTIDPAIELEKATKAFKTALDKHLRGVENRDLQALKETIPPEAETFHLILPSGTTTTAKEFLDGHKDWFEEKDWTIEMKTIYSDNSDNYGIALVESKFNDPDRNGKPYFHNMIVSYALKKVDGKWLVVKDHASTVEKSE